MPEGNVELSDIKQLVADQGAAFAEFKKTNDEIAKQVKAFGAADAVTETKLAKIDGDLHAIAEKIEKAGKRADDLEKKFNRPRTKTDGIELSAEQVEHKAAFNRFVRKGNDNGLSELETKAMSVGSDPDGGYFVPEDTTGRMVKRIYESSPIRQIASVQSISTDSLEGMNDLGEGDAGWVGETQARTETTTPQVGKWSIPAHEMYAMPKATQKLLEDARINVEQWLADKTADKFARTEATAFVSGNGVNKPFGFLSYTAATTADATRAWGQLQYIKTGVNGDFAATLKADKLYDLIGQVKEGFLPGARFVTRREVVTKIRQFKDGDDRYLWEPSLVAGQPQQVLGYPVTVAQDMPALSANGYSLAFGNFAEGYQIVDRLGVQTLRDPFTAKPFVIFYTRKRVGGAVVNFEAIKLLKFAS